MGANDAQNLQRAEGESPRRDHGELPDWQDGDLPEPRPFSVGNAFRTIGPGAILLVAAIGGGEWIVGPLMAVKYGPSILWVATLAIFLQAMFNLEGIRYTLYTGEPIITGFMRLKPGPRFWGWLYIILGAAQLATPALAAGSANVLLAAYLGFSPDHQHDVQIHAIAMGVIVLSVMLLLSGKSIEKVLERLSWVMMVLIFSFLLVVNIGFVPWSVWQRTILGFLTPQPLPENMNIVLLALFAATAGSGGLGNLVISNWFRDKGFGMGKYMGGIGSVLRQGHQELQPIGRVFPPNSENMRRWWIWWGYAKIDQSLLWAMGCVVGMLLNVNLAMAIIPEGMTFQGNGAGVYQAEYLAKAWSGFWALTLVNGFWVLFSTHLGNTDCLVRTTADILWSSSTHWRRWTASRLYAAILLLLTVWALVSVNFGTVLDLFKVLGILASPIMALAAVQILRVNTRLLPKELRPPLWRKLCLVACAVVYGAITVAVIRDQVIQWRTPRPVAVEASDSEGRSPQK